MLRVLLMLFSITIY